MILAYIVMLATDVFWAGVEDGFLKPPHYLDATVNAFSLLAVALGCYWWCMFVEARLGYPESRQGITKYLLKIPIIADCALILSSIFTEWIFYIDLNGIYREGKLFWIQGVITYAYLLIPTVHSIICAIRTGIKRKRAEYLSYVAYIAVPSALTMITDEVKPVPLFALSIFLVIQMLFLTLYIDQENELSKKERELSDSRMAVMLSQIQPHFLYNTLAVIQTMCQDKAPEAAQTTVEFAEFLRGNLDSLARREPIAFERELQHTRNYIALEQKRYGDRLHVEYDIQSDGFLLPALTLQPIVENAVLHGVSEREEGGTVRISTVETENAYAITVADDGVGFDTTATPDDGRTHIGISNVRERLAIMCGGTLEIQSTPDVGTTVQILIPKEA